MGYMSSYVMSKYSWITSLHANLAIALAGELGVNYMVIHGAWLAAL